MHSEEETDEEAARRLHHELNHAGEVGPIDDADKWHKNAQSGGMLPAVLLGQCKAPYQLQSNVGDRVCMATGPQALNTLRGI